MRIGGNARYYAELIKKDDLAESFQKAKELNVPLIVLGGGSNTIFADGTINALVVRIKAEAIKIDSNIVTIEAGKNLPMLINELAKQGLDLSSLTGIPGTIGGAIFGNAGQGPKGIWIDNFVESVTAFMDGKWKKFSKNECGFAYRESVFKKMQLPIIWEITLCVPPRPSKEIQDEIDVVLQNRIETQPHKRTSGSCFKAIGETPAWELIDQAGLRGKKFGGIEISEKHANFLLNTGEATFEDLQTAIKTIRTAVDKPLEIELRIIKSNGYIITND